MPRKKKEEQKIIEEPEINEIEPPLESLSPVYTNFTLTFPATDVMIIDFGFIAPSYSKPYDIRDYHIARICLPWDAVQTLSEDLKKAIEEHKNEIEVKKD